MAEEIKDGAQETEIVESEGKQEEPKAEAQEVFGKDDLTKLLEERDRKWQSKFDKVLAEKKAEEDKAMTVEQRIEQLERERQRERVEWSRKEARARAEIDDDLDEAIRLYASSDPDEIGDGATKIKQLFGARISKYTSRIDELEKQLKYGGKPPAGGGKGDGKAISETEYAKMSPKEQFAFVTGGGQIE